MKKPSKIRPLILLFIVLITGGVGLYTIKNERLRLLALRNPAIKFFLPTYRSLRKIADIPYFIYKLQSDNLPVYSIFIKPEAIALMNAYLPKDIVKGRLLDTNKIKMRADFYAKDYQEKIKIRYRGRGPNHWNAFKKSFQADFQQANPLPGGFTEIKLYIPEDRRYAIEPLNMYRAKKLGLIAPQPWFVKLKLNGQNLGVYMAVSHWSKEWLEINEKPETSNIFGIIDLPLDELQDKDFYNPNLVHFWKDYTKNAEISRDDLTSLKDFLSIVHDAPDKTFEKIIPVVVDMDSMYSWLIINTFAASSHQNSKVNIVLIRDASTGKFQPVPWDAQIHSYKPISLESHPLVKRMLAVHKFREEFLKRLKKYVTNPSNLDDDLKFYDDTVNLIKTPLMKDDAKLPLNYQVNADLKNYRSMVKNNFMTIKKTFDENNTPALFDGKYTQITGKNEFKLSPFLKGATASTNEFINKNPKFYKIDNTTVGIGPGKYYINENVYIPATAALIIKPGTTLYLGENVSLVSFTKIVANGTQSRPIKLLPVSQKPWGSLLVIGTNKQKSEFNHVTVTGGSGFHNFGIEATGMVAIHNGDAEILNSNFENSNDDDALNIKHGEVKVIGSTFKNTYSDGLDVDAGTGVISNNNFSNIGRSSGGDAIDISFSKVEISKNKINKCSDKGVSVGEKSQPVIEENLIANCGIGISVKDLSRADIQKAYLVSNKIGLEAKQKKPIFGGGSALITKSYFVKNDKNIVIRDELSSVNELSNNYSTDISKLKGIMPPLFQDILTEFLSR